MSLPEEKTQLVRQTACLRFSLLFDQVGDIKKHVALVLEGISISYAEHATKDV